MLSHLCGLDERVLVHINGNSRDVKDSRRKAVRKAIDTDEEGQ